METALAFTPSTDFIMEFDSYDKQPAGVTLVYAFMTDNATFPDGKDQFNML